jgi:hypothetical protein
LRRVGLLLAACGALSGCRQASVRDLIREFRGPRYERSVSTSDLRIRLRYIPRTMEVLSRAEVDSLRPVTSALLDSLEGIYRLGDGIRFLMRIDPLDSSMSEDFANDIIYGTSAGYASHSEARASLADGLQEKIWLEVDGSKIPMDRYLMENSFGMTPGRTFVLLFPPLPRASIRRIRLKLVLDDIVPGLARHKLDWTFPVGTHDESI